MALPWLIGGAALGVAACFWDNDDDDDDDDEEEERQRIKDKKNKAIMDDINSFKTESEKHMLKKYNVSIKFNEGSPSNNSEAVVTNMNHSPTKKAIKKEIEEIEEAIKLLEAGSYDAIK